MGNFIIDLDSTFGKFLFTYLDMIKFKDYTTAAEILFEANASLPMGATVSDMDQYKTYHHIRNKDGQALSLQGELAIDYKAKEYCERWAPLVFRAIAKYREEMLARLEDD